MVFFVLRREQILQPSCGMWVCESLVLLCRMREAQACVAAAKAFASHPFSMLLARHHIYHVWHLFCETSEKRLRRHQKTQSATCFPPAFLHYQTVADIRLSWRDIHNLNPHTASTIYSNICLNSLDTGNLVVFRKACLGHNALISAFHSALSRDCTAAQEINGRSL